MRYIGYTLEISNDSVASTIIDQQESQVMVREVVFFQTEHDVGSDTVLSLDDIPEDSLDLVGGKAYNLSILKKMGYLYLMDLLSLQKHMNVGIGLKMKEESWE